MTKQELIAAVAIKGEMTKKAAGIAVDMVLGVIEDTVVSGEAVKIVNFGNWEKKATKGTEGTIQFGDRKGEKWVSEDSFKVSFSAGKGFADRVKGVTE